MNLTEEKILRRVLQAELAEMRARNPAFSQRAFARKIGMNSGTLNSLLQGKRRLSSVSARNILGKIRISERYREWLLQAVESEAQGGTVAIRRSLLDCDRFEIISDPIHLNALNLLRTKRAEPTIAWLAAKLKKAPAEISGVVERLERAGLLRREGRKLVPTGQAMRTPENLPNQAIRSFHRHTLHEAAEKLDSVPVELRDFSAITIPADPARIAEVRELIRGFRDQVSFLLGSEPGSEVYKLAVQFFPVTLPEESR